MDLIYFIVVKQLAAVIDRAPSTRAAWQDDDDSELAISIGDTDRLRKLRPADPTATLDGNELSSALRSRSGDLRYVIPNLHPKKT